MGKFSFHLALPEDSRDMLSIYSPYVTKTAVTFEYDVPTADEFAGRIMMNSVSSLDLR